MSNIYQKRLYDRRKENGLCIDCGKPLDRDGVRCISCRGKKSENERRSKQFYKEVGICPICRKVPIGSSESSCPECRANESIQCNNRRNKSEEARKRYNQEHKEWAKLTYKQDEEKGICPRCRKRKSDYGYLTCGICREKSRNRQRAKASTKKKTWIENGLCCFCGGKVKDGYKVCEKHYQMNLEKARSQKAKEARRELQESGILYYKRSKRPWKDYQKNSIEK